MPRIWLVVLLSYLLAFSIWAVFFVSKVQHQIAIFAVVGVILTAISSVVAIVINNKEIRERELRLLIHKEQQKVFAHFYTALFEILKSVKRPGGNQPPKKAIDEMYEFRRGLMNWASEDLIASYIQYENSLDTSVAAGMTAMLEVADEFLKSMRKELGFEDTGKVSIMSVILDTEARKELLHP